MVHIVPTQVKAQSLSKAQRVQVESVGGYMATREYVLAYFEGLCNAMYDLLGDKVADK